MYVYRTTHAKLSNEGCRKWKRRLWDREMQLVERGNKNC